MSVPRFRPLFFFFFSPLHSLFCFHFNEACQLQPLGAEHHVIAKAAALIELTNLSTDNTFFWINVSKAVYLCSW